MDHLKSREDRSVWDVGTWDSRIHTSTGERENCVRMGLELVLRIYGVKVWTQLPSFETNRKLELCQRSCQRRPTNQEMPGITGCLHKEETTEMAGPFAPQPLIRI